MPDTAHLKILSGGVTYDAQVVKDKSRWKQHAGLIAIQEPEGVGYAAYGYGDDARALVDGPRITAGGVDYPLLSEAYHTPQHGWISPVLLRPGNNYGIYRFTVYVPRGAWGSLWCGDCNLYIDAHAPYSLTTTRGYYVNLNCDGHNIEPAGISVNVSRYEAGYMLPPGRHSICFTLMPNGKTGPSYMYFKTTAF